ncbi:hypothetical protein HN510_03715, partial [Candidatus Woesearchaeota archaeon]|nr:hypothetical protein [Candidatus Woesearchaeota archaeon]
YEFRFKYASIWNSTKSKAVETFNAYKCENGAWKSTDIKLSTNANKMCSEMGGPMVVVEKDDLSKFPTLYNTSADIKVYVATAGNSNNMTTPSDIVDPGWTTPGTVDFSIDNAFAYGADSAKFEDILKQGYVGYEDCYNEIDDDSDGTIDCSDWDCEYSDKCASTGVNAAGFVDTSSPMVTGVKIEEYPDAVLIMYDTNKPTNGTLTFYNNDSTCTSLNTTLYDVGITKNATMRSYKLWHAAHIYSDSSESLAYALANNTQYYYKIKVCDSNDRCSVSKCSNFTTAESTEKCGYCNFVTRLKMPTGWNVSYDVDQDGTYEHLQGQVCGPNAGMKVNYSDGRSVNIKLEKSDGQVYMEFFNTSLTKSGLNDKVRTISDSGDLIHDTTELYVGMESDTRDKIINNLHPEACKIKIPFSGTCSELYHCDDSGNNCEDRTNDATLLDAANCIWQLPYCEFSTWDADGNPDDSSSSSSGGGGGGGGGGGAATGTTYVITNEQFSSGYSNNLGVGDKMKFQVVASNHFVAVNKISGNRVSINVTSELQQASLSIGETKKFDVDSDNYYDLSVTLNSINGTTNADITVKSINEEVVAGSEDSGITGNAVDDSSGGSESGQETPAIVIEEDSSLTWIWVLIVILIVIGAGYWFYNKKQ